MPVSSPHAKKKEEDASHEVLTKSKGAQRWALQWCAPTFFGYLFACLEGQ